MIVDLLRSRGVLLFAEEIVHSYPHDWRSMTPTIFRATEQWFIAVDRLARHSDKSLRTMAMDLCHREPGDNGVTFVPAWGRNRIAGMLESRPDWCISRQRAWGLPIPAFYNPQGKPLLTPKSIRGGGRGRQTGLRRVVQAHAPAVAGAVRPRARTPTWKIPTNSRWPPSRPGGISSTSGSRAVRAGSRRAYSENSWRTCRLIFTSKVPTSIAAGSSFRCCRRWARTGVRPLPRSSRTDSSWTRTA